MVKLERSGTQLQLLSREKVIITVISNDLESKSGKVAEKLSIPSPTI